MEKAPRQRLTSLKKGVEVLKLSMIYCFHDFFRTPDAVGHKLVQMGPLKHVQDFLFDKRMMHISLCRRDLTCLISAFLNNFKFPKYETLQRAQQVCDKEYVLGIFDLSIYKNPDFSKTRLDNFFVHLSVSGVCKDTVVTPEKLALTTSAVYKCEDSSEQMLSVVCEECKHLQPVRFMCKRDFDNDDVMTKLTFSLMLLK
jgi:hypothetical protein